MMRKTDCEECTWFSEELECEWCTLNCMHISDMTPKDCPDKQI